MGPTISVLAWLIAGFAVLAMAAWTLTSLLRRHTGIPSAARILASDGGAAGTLRLRSERLKLSGEPDRVIEERGKYVAVENKEYPSTRLYESEEMQLAAYILLLREHYGKRAADYGYVVYRGNPKPFKVVYGGDLEARFLQHLERTREIKRTRESPRTHNSPAKCQRCAYRHLCDESLA